MRALVAIVAASLLAVACGAFEPSVGPRRGAETSECAEYADAGPYGAPSSSDDGGCGDDS